MKEIGALAAPRTPEQTETAKFFSDIAVGPLQGSLRDLVTRMHMDISDSARLFAAVDISLGDTVHRDVERQVPLRVLAADHGDPAGEDRREPRHRGRRLVGAAS